MVGYSRNRNARWLAGLASGLLALTAAGGCARAPGASDAGHGMDGSIAPQVRTHDVAVAPRMRDGELKVPADYRRWPVFLVGIDKPDSGQIRDIYIDALAHRTAEGDPFPIGTVSVMEIWTAQRTGDGALRRTPDGRLVKDALASIFVMGKSAGAGELVSPALRNGDWVYASYGSDGTTPGGPPAAACRSCHLAQASKDWVFRYDEYFASRRR
ncbi:MAG: cytochrome P460 family protein [Lautropia sp.]